MEAQSLYDNKADSKYGKTARLEPSFTASQTLMLHPNLTNAEASPEPPLRPGAVPFAPWTPLSLPARLIGGGVSEDEVDIDVGGGGFGTPFTLPESRPSVWQNEKTRAVQRRVEFHGPQILHVW